MLRHVIRRLLLLIPLLLGVATLVFAAVQFVPGDPAQIMLGEKASPERLQELRHELGLDLPVAQQYVRYISKTVVFDLGRSVHRNTPISDEIAQRFPATIELATAALFLALVIGIPFGILAALKRGSWLDNLCMAGSLTGVSMPIFWLGLMLMLLFSAMLGWFPSTQRLDIALDLEPLTGLYFLDSLLRGQFDVTGDVLHHLFLPALTLSTVPMALIARMTRAAMLEVLGLDYVRTARAKGAPERTVILKHALQNAAIPIVTVSGLQLGMLLSGAVITETVFSWPGLGTLAVEAIFQRDFPVLQGCVLVFALTFVLVNLVVDLSYYWLDPRLRTR